MGATIQSSNRTLVTACGLLVLMGGTATEAALITFDTVVVGATTFEFDGDGDGVNDVVFSTTDPLGFNTVGPGPNQNFIDEPGLEGTSLLDPDLRVDFLLGATDSLAFGFALNSAVESPAFFASISVFDSSDMLLTSATVAGAFFPSPIGPGLTDFPEGTVSVSFPDVASYATFNFTSEFGRYIIDNFEGTFGSTERIPEPGTFALFGLGLTGLGVFLRRSRDP